MELNDYNWSNIKFTEIFRVTSSKAGTKFFEHGRTDIYQIGLKMTGSSKITYNGNEYDFKTGSVLFLPKENVPDIDYKTFILKQGESLCIFFNSNAKLPKAPILIQQCDIQIYDLFLKIHKAYNSPNRDFFECTGILFEILSAINKKLNKKDEKSNYTEKIITYMQKHVTDKYIDFSLLAKNSNMGIDHFRHTFKKNLNVSPLQYFNKLKTEYIKKLLHNRKYSIKEVALMSGFENFNYFSRFFKKHTGYSPSEYRKIYFM